MCFLVFSLHFDYRTSIVTQSECGWTSSGPRGKIGWSKAGFRGSLIFPIADILRSKQQRMTYIKRESASYRFSQTHFHVSSNLILRPIILFWNHPLKRHNQLKRKKDGIKTTTFQNHGKGVTLMMKKVTARRTAYTNRIKPQLASPFSLFSLASLSLVFYISQFWRLIAI